ncbi:hypothetical protein OEZ85_012037 [Tetradesmus obliquus]|uniref:Uncharacterized protein n=1 Tax=Tetradesmus obliquus TaxID=3088 RepID=A0ABY8TS94_TETOB|nr:hypothetical protein OEZ85_012037 [Tetradesmus obliquus]
MSVGATLDALELQQGRRLTQVKKIKPRKDKQYVPLTAAPESSTKTGTATAKSTPQAKVQPTAAATMVLLGQKKAPAAVAAAKLTTATAPGAQLTVKASRLLLVEPAGGGGGRRRKKKEYTDPVVAPGEAVPEEAKVSKAPVVAPGAKVTSASAAPHKNAAVPAAKASSTAAPTTTPKAKSGRLLLSHV